MNKCISLEGNRSREAPPSLSIAAVVFPRKMKTRSTLQKCAGLFAALAVCAFPAAVSQALGGFLYVANYDHGGVWRYDEATGDFVDNLVQNHTAGLNQAWGIVISPHDHNLYVTSGEFNRNGGPKTVMRFDLETGDFIDIFASATLTSPRGLVFGSDGNLYVADGDGPGRIVRFDGHSGEWIDDFVPLESGGLSHPQGLLFGPDGNLYVANEGGHNILRFDGTTGAFLGEFVPYRSHGLTACIGITFGPDGNLYVANLTLSLAGADGVLRFEGPFGSTPGAALPARGQSGAMFIPSGSGGLLKPFGVLFGPDGNGDGEQDLYGSTGKLTSLRTNKKSSQIKRYDGKSGQFIDTFVPPGNKLDGANMMFFAETNPTTLAYTGR